MLKVLDHDFDVDMMDLDVSGPVWERLNTTKAKIENITTSEPGDDFKAIHAKHVELFEMFTSDLDFVLGEGATEKLLDGKRLFSLAMKAWYDMCTGLTLQYADSTRQITAMQKDAAKQFSAARIAKR